MISSQFVTYLMFAVIWPCLFALLYAGLERLFPQFLLVDHGKE
ncbi:MAG: hypothetical protein ACRECO_18475 [Xanthobacteraceae bacterium]